MVEKGVSWMLIFLLCSKANSEFEAIFLLGNVYTTLLVLAFAWNVEKKWKSPHFEGFSIFSAVKEPQGRYGFRTARRRQGAARRLQWAAVSSWALEESMFWLQGHVCLLLDLVLVGFDDIVCHRIGEDVFQASNGTVRIGRDGP